jgi:hypothetical protein
MLKLLRAVPRFRFAELFALDRRPMWRQGNLSQ